MRIRVNIRRNGNYDYKAVLKGNVVVGLKVNGLVILYEMGEID